MSDLTVPATDEGYAAGHVLIGLGGSGVLEVLEPLQGRHPHERFREQPRDIFTREDARENDGFGKALRFNQSFKALPRITVPDDDELQVVCAVHRLDGESHLVEVLSVADVSSVDDLLFLSIACGAEDVGVDAVRHQFHGGGNPVTRRDPAPEFLRRDPDEICPGEACLLEPPAQPLIKAPFPEEAKTYRCVDPEVADIEDPLHLRCPFQDIPRDPGEERRCRCHDRIEPVPGEEEPECGVDGKG